MSGHDEGIALAVTRGDATPQPLPPNSDHNNHHQHNNNNNTQTLYDDDALMLMMTPLPTPHATFANANTMAATLLPSSRRHSSAASMGSAASSASPHPHGSAASQGAPSSFSFSPATLRPRPPRVVTITSAGAAAGANGMASSSSMASGPGFCGTDEHSSEAHHHHHHYNYNNNNFSLYSPSVTSASTACRPHSATRESTSLGRKSSGRYTHNPYNLDTPTTELPVMISANPISTAGAAAATATVAGGGEGGSGLMVTIGSGGSGSLNNSYSNTRSTATPTIVAATTATNTTTTTTMTTRISKDNVNNNNSNINSNNSSTKMVTEGVPAGMEHLGLQSPHATPMPTTTATNNTVATNTMTTASASFLCDAAPPANTGRNAPGKVMQPRQPTPLLPPSPLLTPLQQGGSAHQLLDHNVPAPHPHPPPPHHHFASQKQSQQAQQQQQQPSHIPPPLPPCYAASPSYLIAPTTTPYDAYYTSPSSALQPPPPPPMALQQQQQQQQQPPYEASPYMFCPMPQPPMMMMPYDGNMAPYYAEEAEAARMAGNFLYAENSTPCMAPYMQPQQVQPQQQPQLPQQQEEQRVMFADYMPAYTAMEPVHHVGPQGTVAAEGMSMHTEEGRTAISATATTTAATATTTAPTAVRAAANDPISSQSAKSAGKATARRAMPIARNHTTNTAVRNTTTITTTTNTTTTDKCAAVVETNATAHFMTLIGRLASVAMTARGRHLLTTVIRLQHTEKTKLLLTELLPEMDKLVLDPQGCQVVRVLVEHIPTDQLLLLLSAMQPYTVLQLATTSQHTRQVLQAIFEHHHSARLDTLVDVIASDARRLSMTQQGCLAMMTLIENALPRQRQAIVSRLMPVLPMLTMDPYANYVVQCILRNMDGCTTATVICAALSKYWVPLCCNKYASNVVEKIVWLVDGLARHQMVQDLIFNEINLLRLLNDEYGNFVLQSIVNSSSNLAEFQCLFVALGPNLHLSPFGHRIEAKLRSRYLALLCPTAPYVAQL